MVGRRVNRKELEMTDNLFILDKDRVKKIKSKLKSDSYALGTCPFCLYPIEFQPADALTGIKTCEYCGARIILDKKRWT